MDHHVCTCGDCELEPYNDVCQYQVATEEDWDVLRRILELDGKHPAIHKIMVTDIVEWVKELQRKQVNRIAGL